MHDSDDRTNDDAEWYLYILLLCDDTHNRNLYTTYLYIPCTYRVHCTTRRARLKRRNKHYTMYISIVIHFLGFKIHVLRSSKEKKNHFVIKVARIILLSYNILHLCYIHKNAKKLALYFVTIFFKLFFFFLVPCIVRQG